MQDDMKDKIKLILDGLTEADKELLKARLNGEPRPKSRKQITQSKNIDDEIENTKKTPRRRIKKAAQVVDDEDEVKPRRDKRGKSKPRADGRAARPLALETGPRANRFSTSEDFNTDKHLTKEDKANWKGRKPTPRVRSTIVEAQCATCGGIFEVNETLANTVRRFVCDDCIPRR
jgi:hypothetical protein